MEKIGGWAGGLFRDNPCLDWFFAAKGKVDADVARIIVGRNPNPAVTLGIGCGEREAFRLPGGRGGV